MGQMAGTAAESCSLFFDSCCSSSNDHQRGVFVLGQCGVFRVGVGLPHARNRERVGREERPVDIAVAVADFIDTPLGGADAVLEDAVFDDRLAVVAQDAVHLGGVEEIGEDDVGDRHEDEPDQDFANQAVGAQPERGRHHVVREDLRFVRQLPRTGPQRPGIESVSFLLHRGKNSLIRCKFSLKCVILQPEIKNVKTG